MQPLSKECLLAEEVFTPIINGLSSILNSVNGVTPLAFAAAFAFFLWRTDSFFVALDFAGCLAISSRWFNQGINQTPSASLWIGTVTFGFSIWLIVLAHTITGTFIRIAKYFAGFMSIHSAGSNSFLPIQSHVLRQCLADHDADGEKSYKVPHFFFQNYFTKD